MHKIVLKDNIDKEKTTSSPLKRCIPHEHKSIQIKNRDRLSYAFLTLLYFTLVEKGDKKTYVMTTLLYRENQTLVLTRLDLEDLVASSVVREMRASKASTKVLTLVFPSGFNLRTSFVIAWLSIHSRASFVS